ncbi:MAG: NAD(P)/FAD-dependent oxidoreductase [Halanaerobiaceae bacterium]
MYDLIVVGAGAAGMMAAGRAAEKKKSVLLLEKNARPGKKLLITGKGRCNLTNDCEIEEMIANFFGNGKFLYNALYTFPNWRLRQFFADLGVETKVERGKRVFPVSDSARDVVEALQKYINKSGVEIKYKQAVEKVHSKKEDFFRVVTRKGQKYDGHNLLLATGGKSYPGTGSSGDGYEIAQRLGHDVTNLYPSLVPLNTKEEWPKEAQGLTLKNVRVSLEIEGEDVDSEFGELLFTHFGVSGPTVLTLSRRVVPNLDKDVKLKINLKPALNFVQLDERLQRDFKKYARKQFKNSLGDLLPAKLRSVIIGQVSIPSRKEVNQITKKERRELVEVLQNLELTVTGSQGFRAAVVTAGGVATDEIDPRNMSSRLLEGLYFAGEIIDIDGLTGGFNLQAAFSTGYVVGESVGEKS